MNPETIPTTLETLFTAAKAQDDQYTQVAVTPADLQFVPEGIRCRGKLIDLDQPDLTRIYEKIGAPPRYLAGHSRALQAAVLTEHAEQGDFGPKPQLIMRNGKFVTVVDGRLAALPNSAVLWAVDQGLGKDSQGLSVARISGDVERFDLELVSEAKQAVIRPGDVVQAGLRISHQRFGGQAIVVEAFVLRLVCSNGMTRRECTQNGIQRTRRLPADAPNSFELQMDQVRRLTEQTWRGLQLQLEALQATNARPANVEELLTRWLLRARISARRGNRMMDTLLAAWREEGGENTVFGAINALTRVATHNRVMSERQRRQLASLAGILAFSEVHVCPRCFSVLAANDNNAQDPAQPPSDSTALVLAGSGRSAS